MGGATFGFRGGTILILHDDFDNQLCSTGHGGHNPHVASRDHGGLLASAKLDLVEHGVLASAGGLSIIHPGVDVLQVAKVDFVQGDLHGYLHIENVVAQGVGEEDGQREGVCFVHQDPHAPPKMDHGAGELATLCDTWWDPGAGQHGAIGAEAVAPGRKAQVRRKREWAYEGDGPNYWEMVQLGPSARILEGSPSGKGSSIPCPLLTALPGVVPVHGKAIERILLGAITSQMKHVIGKSQHGFTKGKSCLTHLIAFYDKATCSDDRLLMRYGLDKQSVRWVGNWLTDRTQKVVVNSSFSNWQPVTMDLDDGIKRTLMKFADDTKLSGEVDTSEGRSTLQEDLDRLEEWANKNLMKFSKDKCKVLHLGKHNPGVQHRLGSTQLGSTSVERDLGDNKLKMNEQCAAVAKKANRMLGCTSRDKEVIIPLCSVLVRPHLEYCVQFWSPLFKNYVDRLVRVQRSTTKMIKGLRSLPYEERLRELGLLSLEKRRLRGDLITMFQYLKGGYKEDFTRNHMEKMRGNGYKLLLGRIRLAQKENFSQ
ncbi:hypothetical protein QYF61_021241 [Mycteria americana]|uniref:Rna-directed dna polymerase from mobile element jockey-like n=1 Tax=Mycteria americana TaxID=33587 RepID=A0AAN7RKM7_MYCAM|nr:hypothetical protein QYF61_021241 [Mycteria americana]